MFEIDGKVLHTENWSVSFPENIDEILECQGVGVVVALLCYGLGKDDFNNIYAAKDGKVIWQIQDATEYNRHFKRVDKFYSMVRVYEEDPRFLIATTNGGFRFVIDPLTGRIIDQESEVR